MVCFITAYDDFEVFIWMYYSVTIPLAICHWKPNKSSNVRTSSFAVGRAYKLFDSMFLGPVWRRTSAE